MAEITVGADLLTYRLAELEQRHGVVHHETGMHLERQFMHSVIARELSGLLPVRNHSFLPLPVENLRILGRPAIGRPIGHGVGCIASRASRESDDDTNSQTFRQLHGAPEYLRVALRTLGVRMKRVTVAAEHSHLNVPVFKFLFPGPELGVVGE